MITAHQEFEALTSRIAESAIISPVFFFPFSADCDMQEKSLAATGDASERDTLLTALQQKFIQLPEKERS